MTGRSSVEGKRIVITRSISQSDSLRLALEQRGAVPLSYPCIAIAPVEDTALLDAALGEAAQGKFDWLVVTSLNTVEALQSRMRALNLTLDRQAIAAVGAKTAQAARRLPGGRVLLQPEESHAAALAAVLKPAPGMRIFLPQSDAAPDVLARALEEHGAKVVTVTAYRNTIGQGGVDLPALLQNNQVDAITFMSGSAVENFVRRMHLSSSPGHLPAMIYIGAATARTARHLGLPVTRVADNTLESLLHELETYFS